MKTLTLTQPWATLVASGAKRIETRHWQTRYRGPLAIHAAIAMPRQVITLSLQTPFRQALATAGYRPTGPAHNPYLLPLGAVLATCELTACAATEDPWLARVLADCPATEAYFGDFSAGRYGLVLDRVTRLAQPIPAKGALLLWEWEAQGVAAGARS